MILMEEVGEEGCESGVTWSFGTVSGRINDLTTGGRAPLGRAGVVAVKAADVMCWTSAVGGALGRPKAALILDANEGEDGAIQGCNTPFTSRGPEN